MGKAFFILFFLVGSFAFSEENRLIAVNRSLSLKVPGLESASVANGKILKVRAVPPQTLVVTALSRGITTVRAWDHSGKETVFQIRVVGSDLYEQSWESSKIVKIGMEFLELDSHFNQELGIRWPEKIQFSANAAVQGNSASSGLNYTTSFTSAQGWIKHLVEEGWAKILASPELFVRLGEEAVFHSGGEFPVTTVQSAYGQFNKHVEWKPFGITVKLKPASADSFHISSDVHVELSEMDPSNAFEGIPGLTKRNVDTKMNSRDGETVILSGLVRKATVQSKEGLPFLSSIPLIGGILFSSKGNTADSTEVLLAMTLSFTTSQDWKKVDDRRKRFRDWDGSSE